MLKTKNIKFKRRVMVAGLVAVAAAAIAPLTSCSALDGLWGPARDTYSMNNPADKVTFNSITDNNIIGDERNFVRVADAQNGVEFDDRVEIVPGREYQVYIFFHNDGKSSLNESGKGIARGVTVRTGLSSWKVSKGNDVKVTGVVKAENSDPKEVWDAAIFYTNSVAPVELKFVEGSAKIYNQGKLNGSTLPSSLFSDDGAYIGYNTFSGVIPACEEYSGHIIYNVRAVQAGQKVTKTVSKDGTNFSKSVSAKAGDVLTYKVEWQNTGTMDINDVTFHDNLPSGVTLVPGSTYLTNLANPNGIKMSDVIGKNGFKTGLYGPGTKATVTYQVKLNDNIVAKAKCNSKTSFKNTIFVDDSVGEVQDSASFVVKRTCKNTDCTPGDPECPVPDCVPGDPECPNEDCVPGDPECPDPDPDCTPGDPECPDPDPDCVPGDPECPIPTDECADDDLDCICKENPKDPRCGTTTNPPELPKTGPGEIALAIVAVVCISTGGIYWYRSQKDLAKVTGSLDKGPKASKK